MPVYRSFLDDRYTYAVMLGLGAYMPEVIRRAFADFTVTYRKCVLTWRELIVRMAPVNRIAECRAAIAEYGMN